MPIDTFTSILHEFANRINLVGLQIDSSGYCCLDVDHGTLIHIKHENKRDSMIFIAEIGKIPEINFGAIMRYMLRMNDNAEESKGMTLAYNAESAHATIGYQYPLRFINIDKFEEFFKIFLDEVDRWKKKIELYTQGTLPEGEEEMANVPGAEVAQDFSAGSPEFMIGA